LTAEDLLPVGNRGGLAGDTYPVNRVIEYLSIIIRAGSYSQVSARNVALSLARHREESDTYLLRQRGWTEGGGGMGYEMMLLLLRSHMFHIGPFNFFSCFFFSAFQP